mmetsp:Transcript_4657/g.8718  ORF Transcript_4657/g.8718 Transcript_4657/m.8718 type:complete len:115 (-) Transcript_4657:790-1134(-)
MDCHSQHFQRNAKHLSKDHISKFKIIHLIKVSMNNFTVFLVNIVEELNYPESDLLPREWGRIQVCQRPLPRGEKILIHTSIFDDLSNHNEAIEICKYKGCKWWWTLTILQQTKN